MSDALSVSCFDCHEPIPQPHVDENNIKKPCKNCGSTKRAYGMDMAVESPFYTTLRFKARSPGRRPFAEGFVGDSLHKLTGVWHQVERIVSRNKNWYRERISDRKTGEVIRHVEHPLSEHKGRGDDHGPRTPGT